MIRVLIAEDSPVVQRILVSILSEEQGIEIVGVVDNGREAVAKTIELRPDLVTMDIYMPEMDGVQATRLIMDQAPTRIVIISSMVNARDLKTTFEAIRSGAIEVIEKPHGVLSGRYDEVRTTLVGVIRKMMQARPVRRPSPSGDRPSRSARRPRPTSSETLKPRAIANGEIPERFMPRLVCIGGSTGAPAVVCDILSRLPASYPIPIVVAQHIVRGFIQGMAEWLNTTLALEVRVAAAGDRVAAGCVLVAPDHCHMRIAADGRVELVNETVNQLYTPSVDLLFSSVAENYGPGALAVVLSGMGHDGASGIREIRDAGGMTIAQDERSSVVFGMPRMAVESGGVVREMDPGQIGAQLLKYAVKNK